MRRAVNYAIDRAAISASYGPGFARPTCQLRPPGTVGFRRYCPYTAAPDGTGEWKAPDLARARRLVAASGTRGMSVTVWTYPGLWEAGARGTVRALEDLGYRARVEQADDLEAYVAKVTDEKTQGVQAGVIGWYGVNRTARSLLDMFLCDSPDWSFFCDRRFDARITRALELQASDPDAAVAPWARIERDLVDLAPWVPLFTPAHTTSSPSGWATTSTTPSGGSWSTSSGCARRRESERSRWEAESFSGCCRAPVVFAATASEPVAPSFARPRNRLRARALGAERPSPGSASSQVEWRGRSNSSPPDAP